MHTHLIHGHSPIVLSVPHDGATLLLGMPSRSMSKPRDLGTLPLAQTLRIALQSLGLDASMIWLDLHRSLVDTNDEIHRRAYVSGLESEFDAYHDLLDQTIEDVLARNDRCFLLDIHRCDFPGGPDLILGSDEHRTSLRSFDKTLADHLRATCSVAFSPDHALGIDRRYRGGWIVRRAAKQFGTQGLDAVQLELNEPIWRPDRLHQVPRDLALAVTQTILRPHLSTHNEKQAPL